MPNYRIETAGALEPYIRREWLLTNGLGSSASSTLIGCNTRRYHSLLCAAMHPPAERHVMLSRIGEIVELNHLENPTYELSVNQFEHDLHPHGYQHQLRFELSDTAKWTYQVADVAIEKEVLLCWKRNVTGIRYTVQAGSTPVHLELLPFVAMRDFHALRHGTDVRFQLQSWGNHATITDQKLYLQLASDKANWVEKPYWWYGHVYPVEAFRGQDSSEELWNPGRFTFDVESGTQTVIIWASSEPADMPDWDAQLALRKEAAAIVRKTLPAPASRALRTLWDATDAYISDRRLPGGQTGKTILAGYPWFLDWGRDTMISLPGLLLTTERYEDAFEVLAVFARHVSQGMIPNRFDDYGGEAEYNTVDASLWFILACFAYLKCTHATARFDQVLRPACDAIVDGYKGGTRYFIRMDPEDGLISQGDASTQLTWMDAKTDGIAFTPRQGKPVEINALWYNALVLLGQSELAAKVKANFVNRFWISPYRGLADAVEGARADESVRPNQIFAVSLPHSPLNEEQQRGVVEVVRRELLTPYGLRTLAASDPKYCARFEGGPRQRDSAYHNGTVWPWLIGPYIEAYLKVHRQSAKAKEQARQWLAPLLAHMDDACLGQIAEVFDGDLPHRPAGCCAQAWSVAEVLRVAVMVGV